MPNQTRVEECSPNHLSILAIRMRPKREPDQPYNLALCKSLLWSSVNVTFRDGHRSEICVWSRLQPVSTSQLFLCGGGIDQASGIVAVLPYIAMGTLLPLRFQPRIRRLARICTPMKVETAPLVLCRARSHLRPTGCSRVRCKIRRFQARTRTASSSECLRSHAGISAAPATMHKGLLFRGAYRQAKWTKRYWKRLQDSALRTSGCSLSRALSCPAASRLSMTQSYT
jgi:hypothetical protein